MPRLVRPRFRCRKSSPPTRARIAPRVFVADDQPFVRLAVRLALTREGYEVLELEDGQALVDAVGASRPDLVLSDEHMPRLGGLGALARLRADGVDVPFVLMSGSLDPAAAAEACRLGVSALLEKPFGLTDLLSAVAARVRAAPDGGSPRAKARAR